MRDVHTKFDRLRPNDLCVVTLRYLQFVYNKLNLGKIIAELIARVYCALTLRYYYNV